jgi:ATP-dependent protease ClpP protease subunit
MMRNLAVAAALVASSSAFAGNAPGKPSTDPNPMVKVEGDTLTYVGGINEAGLTALSNAVHDLPRDRIRKMVVNSGGGDTKAGIFIGSIIGDLKPDLFIETGCFSSCANFIAPAAGSITIRENAFLGWHGNDRGFKIAAAEAGLSLREHMRSMVANSAKDAKDADGKPVDIEAFLDEAVATLEVRIEEEAALYKRIGMPNDTFAICGVGDRFESRLTGQQLGWGFSVADMARLGLPPVTFVGEGAYEDSAGFKMWLIRLTPEDCQP